MPHQYFRELVPVFVAVSTSVGLMPPFAVRPGDREVDPTDGWRLARARSVDRDAAMTAAEFVLPGKRHVHREGVSRHVLRDELVVEVLPHPHAPAAFCRHEPMRDRKVPRRLERLQQRHEMCPLIVLGRVRHDRRIRPIPLPWRRAGSALISLSRGALPRETCPLSRRTQGCRPAPKDAGAGGPLCRMPDTDRCDAREERTGLPTARLAPARCRPVLLPSPVGSPHVWTTEAP